MKYVYDAEPPYGAGVWANATDPGQFNHLRGRLAAIAHRNDSVSNWLYSYFSYDTDGNIEWVVHQIDGFEKKIEYEYDFAGNSTKIIYNRNGTNQFYLWYDYDDLGQVAVVFTNISDSKPALAAARYEYWPNGQVKTEKVGEDTGPQYADILNYTFNERDWLKGINAANGIDDINPGAPSTNFAQHLHYYNAGTAQYNGNISMAENFTNRPEGNFNSPEGSFFHRYGLQYDGVNQLTQAVFAYTDDPSSWPLNSTQAYDVDFAYDFNGNLQTLERKDEAGASNLWTYNYQLPTTNRLDFIANLNGQLSGNYIYDRNGNLIQDQSKELFNIQYDHRNLPLKMDFDIPDQLNLNSGTVSTTRTYQAKNSITAQSSFTVTSSGNVTFEAGTEIKLLPGFSAEAGSQFRAAIDPNLINAQSNAIDNVYDYSGSRIQKSYTTGLKRYYIRGAAGRTLAVLDENGTELFYNLRGLDLLGQYDVSTGAEVYFLKDHLGNIRVTIDDNGNVMGYNDYYPFGLQMPRRIYNGGLANNLYRYSSKELDEESNLDWYSFGARFYDHEIGRWHVADPAGQYFSPYAYVGNRPLLFVDPDGRFGFFAVVGALFASWVTGNIVNGINQAFDFDVSSNYPGLSFPIYGNPSVTDVVPPFYGFSNGPGLPHDHRHGPYDPCICPGRTAGDIARDILNRLRGYFRSLFGTARDLPQFVVDEVNNTGRFLIHDTIQTAPAYGLRLVQVTATGADITSEYANYLAGLGLIAGQPEIAGGAFAVGRVADLTSLGAKAILAAVDLNQNSGAFGRQAVVFGLGEIAGRTTVGKVAFNPVTKRFVNTSTGRFVKTSTGYAANSGRLALNLGLGTLKY